MKVLITCPPMLGMIDAFQPTFERHGIDITAAKITQTLSHDALIQIVPRHDGWIIGDDPATRDVFAAGKAGRLRAAVKWGVGLDNVDVAACEALGIPITNTPNMFGNEVADVAIGYVVALAREIHQIDAGVRQGQWPKPRGISLAGKTAALVGFGDVGKNTAKRLLAANMSVIAYDPFSPDTQELLAVQRETWPQRIDEADFIVLTCALTDSSRHMVNAEIFAAVKRDVRIVNVARGAVIDERSLEEALQSGKVYSAALDVFEVEPLPMASALRDHPRCILGSHNASNTAEAVTRTSKVAIDKLVNFLQVSQ